MNNTISSATHELPSKRPLWYGLALWLNPLITWGLLWAIFSLNPLSHKFYLFGTSEVAQTGSIEAILHQPKGAALAFPSAGITPARFPWVVENLSAQNPGTDDGAVSGSVPHDSN